MLEQRDFLAAFGSHVFIRAIWPLKSRPGDMPRPIELTPAGWKIGEKPQLGAAYSWYGPVKDWPAASSFARRLNELGYGIYFAVNDPGMLSLRAEDVQEIRALYQDNDTGADADLAIAGRLPHLTICTSNVGGVIKSQSFWLTEPLPPAWQAQIHSYMVQFHGHDKDSHGVARLMRMPGFHNTKYVDEPLVKIIRAHDLDPRLAEADIMKHFALAAVRKNANVMRSMNRVQGSRNTGRSNVVDLDMEKAKRGTWNQENRDEYMAKLVGEYKKLQIETSQMLVWLSMLDPDCSYSVWVAILGGIKKLLVDQDLAYRFANAWSSLAPHRFNQAVFDQTWKSLKVDRPDLKKYNTIFQMADRFNDPHGARKRYQSATFKRLAAELPEKLDTVTRTLQWPVTRAEEGRGPVPVVCLENTRVLFECLGIKLAYDGFTQDMTSRIEGVPGYVKPDDWMLVDARRTALDNQYEIGKQVLFEHCEMICREERVNPPRAWLESLPPWDGIERLNTIFQRHLGVKDSLLAREMGVLSLIAPIKRIYEPGYKYDYMLILEGIQGKGKSSIFKLLCPEPEWFTNSPRLDLEEKRLYKLIAGKMFIEFGEMAGKRRVDIERLKQFITQTTDEYIANYGRMVTRVDRTAIFIASTNEKRYLRDMSGNRRFVVLETDPNVELNYANVLAEKRQLWAEALALSDMYDQLKLSTEAEKLLEGVQETRLEFEPNVLEILDEVKKFKNGFITYDSLWAAMGINRDDRIRKSDGNRKHAMAQLRQRMEAIGWEDSTPRKINGRSKRGLILKLEKKAPLIIYTERHGLIYEDDWTTLQESDL